MREIPRRPGPALTLLDRLIAWASPAAGLDRLRARTALSVASGGYRGGRRSERRRMRGGSADADSLDDAPDLRARARDLARNMPVATGAVDVVTRAAIGPGLTPRPAIDRTALGLDNAAASAIEAAMVREWRLAQLSLDWERRQVGEELQGLLLRAVLDSGDVLVIRRWRLDPGDSYGLKIQVVEADRVCNPGFQADGPYLAGGVQTDVNGVPTAYHVVTPHPGDARPGALSWRAVPARYSDGRLICLHLYRRDRPGQTRGVPYLAPVVEALKDLGDYFEAEARAAVVAALYTVFVTSDAPGGDTPAAATGASPGTGGGGDPMELKPGAIIELGEGEDITVANPGRPNPAFDAFVSAVCRQIGMALGIPYEVLILHFSSSYSASRGALEVAYQTFLWWRVFFVRQYLAAVWEWVIEESVLTGRLRLPGYLADPATREAWLGCEWRGPAPPILDRLKEANADKVDVDNLFASRADVVARRNGGDWDAVIAKRAEEVAREQALGLAPEAAAGAVVPDRTQEQAA